MAKPKQDGYITNDITIGRIRMNSDLEDGGLVLDFAQNLAKDDDCEF